MRWWWLVPVALVWLSPRLGAMMLGTPTPSGVVRAVPDRHEPGQPCGALAGDHEPEFGRRRSSTTSCG